MHVVNTFAGIQRLQAPYIWMQLLRHVGGGTSKERSWARTGDSRAAARMAANFILMFNWYNASLQEDVTQGL